MYHKRLIYTGVILFSLLVITYIYPWCIVEYTKSKGDEIITKIESYKIEHDGLYPQSLRQLGFEVQDSDGICLYKGSEFYYDCIGDIGGEFSLFFYYSNDVYTYESVIRSWGKGTMAEERNMQLYKLYYKILLEYQDEVSDKWIYDSVYYSVKDSQNVAKVRLFYRRNGNLAARGYILQNPSKTKIGNWIYYTDTGESLNVIYNKSSANATIVQSLSSEPCCGTGLSDDKSEIIKSCIVGITVIVVVVWLFRRKKSR